MAEPNGDILTLNGVATYLKTGKHSIYRLAANGEIPMFKLGGAWRFPRSERDQWIAASVNETKPLFGLEVTATPFVESGKGVAPFKNVVMDYPLARAIEDGFVKEPAVVTQRNFIAEAHTPEEVDKIKLEDGVRLHETTKVELLTYARENGVAVAKPFMRVIARGTTHAASLLALLESDAFFEERYAGKVIQADSSRSSAEEEAMIARLLAVENAKLAPGYQAPAAQAIRKTASRKG